MLAYEILLHGLGLRLLDENGATRDGGVYTWRVVIAEDSDSAIDLARESLLSDPHFTENLWNESMGDLVFEVEEIREKVIGQQGEDTGFVFYIEED